MRPDNGSVVGGSPHSILEHIPHFDSAMVSQSKRFYHRTSMSFCGPLPQQFDGHLYLFDLNCMAFFHGETRKDRGTMPLEFAQYEQAWAGKLLKNQEIWYGPSPTWFATPLVQANWMCTSGQMVNQQNKKKDDMDRPASVGHGRTILLN